MRDGINARPERRETSNKRGSQGWADGRKAKDGNKDKKIGKEKGRN